MEENANYFIEKELSTMNIEVTRYTNVTFLLVTKDLKKSIIYGKLENTVNIQWVQMQWKIYQEQKY